ncbi:uncharacterized protein FOMMEDRAFT_145659 [Fomitiporia mediterranea MF3/22]|uniref:uncharacterized protein n=1 Tax=Fomitiporia mediterranea (strain MF3/22) TaxID=694068 RepID=UPI0004408F04|nr:uncharacterized protein FOMMEDRAFT_145659 [Fomitiporia mediterranea MF3/22]EJD04989.1 hypothetical protein FOMMEDRAFT_145659 [Fomitiporia mediterranea MF3/22]
MSHTAGYDKGLLDEAPEVTKQQRQRFYDADLLNDEANQRPTGGAAPTSGATAPAPARSNTDIEAGHSGARSKEYTQLPPPTARKTPWYKTRAGILGLVILAVIIVGAVVGGAVGGTQAHKKSNNTPVSTLPASIAPTDGTTTSDSSAQSAAPQGGESSSTGAAPPATATTSQQAGQGTAAAPAVPGVPAISTALATQADAGIGGAANVIAVSAATTQVST